MPKNITGKNSEKLKYEIFSLKIVKKCQKISKKYLKNISTKIRWLGAWQEFAYMPNVNAPLKNLVKQVCSIPFSAFYLIINRSEQSYDRII